LMKVVSDVFGLPVYGSSGSTSSASRGAAFRAAHGWFCGNGGQSQGNLQPPPEEGASYVSIGEVVQQLASVGSADELLGLTLVATPDLDNTKVYAEMAAQYAELEADACWTHSTATTNLADC
jgi:hypothetical protein